jgi:hypothetical protein
MVLKTRSDSFGDGFADDRSHLLCYRERNSLLFFDSISYCLKISTTFLKSCSGAIFSSNFH